MIAFGPGARSRVSASRTGHSCRHDPPRVVARQPLFASLTEEECRALVERSACRAVARGEVLFREGETSRGLHLIVEGTVRVYRASPDGQEQVLNTLGPGDSLGEVAVFDEGPYLASARAIETGRVLFLPFREVHALYRTHPQVAQAVVRELGSRVRKMAALVDQLALHDVPTRVAAAVLRHAEEAGVLGRGASFRLPRTQEELAAELGTTRESVARALRELREGGVIRQRAREFAVLDPPRLSLLASGKASRAT